jgi:hypothetical protein
MSETSNFDAGNEADVKKRKTKAQLKREREIEEVKQVLSTVSGRATIWRILDWCGVYRTSFTGNSETFFNEGKRNIGLKLIEEIFASDKNAFYLMSREATDKQEDNNG